MVYYSLHYASQQRINFLEKNGTIFPRIVSSLKKFPPFNSFLGNYSIHEVKNCHNAEIIWKFSYFPLSKKKSVRRNYSQKYGNSESWYVKRVQCVPVCCIVFTWHHAGIASKELNFSQPYYLGKNWLQSSIFRVSI